MKNNKILQADYLDILFQNRNKNYGGYELRSHYNNRMRAALAFVVLICGALCSFTLVGNKRPPIVNIPSSDTTELSIIPMDFPKPKIIEPVAASAPTKKVIDNPLPIIVTTIIDKPDDSDKPQDTNPNGAGKEPGPAIGNHFGGGKDSIGSDADIKPAIAVSNEPVPYVPQMPEFNGNLNDYLSKNLHYPEMARERNTEGKVIIQFIVNEDGSIVNAKIMKGIGGGCDDEALRVVNAMPKWKPGKNNGIPARVYFTLPIIFELQ